MINLRKLSIITAVNDWNVADANICNSQILERTDTQFIPVEGFSSASKAYNYGIDHSESDILIFAHQDVYIPANWDQQISKIITNFENRQTPWAVLGIIGVGQAGTVQGCTWSTGIGREVGSLLPHPVPAVSLDELLLIINKNSGLRFDPQMPGWHLYGTDIVQEALHRNFSSFIIPAPVIHNSLPVLRFDRNFHRCYHYLRKKWSTSLPLTTCCTKITRFSWPLLKRSAQKMFSKTDRDTFHRLLNPALKAKELGYE